MSGENVEVKDGEDEIISEAISFEAALLELENVVSTLEAGQVPLEKSIVLLQRGLKLADRCDAVLTRAETTLEQIVANQHGELELHRLDDDEDEVEDDEV